MEILYWIVGIPIGLWIAWRIFRTLSILGRGILLGMLLGIGAMQLDWSFWIGFGSGIALGCAVLPLLCLIAGIDYKYMEKLSKCPYCGSTRTDVRVESNGCGDYDTHTVCKSCGRDLD